VYSHPQRDSGNRRKTTPTAWTKGSDLEFLKPMWRLLMVLSQEREITYPHLIFKVALLDRTPAALELYNSEPGDGICLDVSDIIVDLL